MPLSTDYIRVSCLKGAASDLDQSCHQWGPSLWGATAPHGWDAPLSTREGQGGAG